ncbi:hypothetical protein D3C78_1709370 [compost metagenome]
MKAITSVMPVFPLVVSSASISRGRMSPRRFDRSPIIRMRTFSRCRSARSRRMKALSKPIRSVTSACGLFQFSDENAKSVR